LLPFLRAVEAEIDFAPLQPWNTEPAQTVAANEYQLARAAVQAGDHPAALQHVEQAILAQPAQATAAFADPAFCSIKVPVHDLVTRLILAARERAEASISEARTALQQFSASTTARSFALARTYLQAAQSTFQLSTYTGFVQSAIAARLALEITRGKRSRPSFASREGVFARVKRATQRAARQLGQRLPLLAILLGWFFAGVIASTASLAFQAGAAFRAWLLPAWATGLMALVLVGFVRSIRRIGQRRN
jgi:hypothetical protein